jgi:zinc and cadmium transporter
MSSALVYALVAALGNLMGALAVTRRAARGLAVIEHFVAFGAGFMLAVAIVEVLPEAFARSGPAAPALVLGGYLAVHLSQHTLTPHFHFGEETHARALLEPAAAYLAILGLGVHTIFDGVAIAAGFMIGPALGALLSMAVFLHKVPEGFTIASIMLASGQSRAAAVGAGATLGALTIAGAIATGFVAEHHVGYALAVSAGVTIYVAASDLIPEVNREGGPALGWTVFAGLVLFALADWLLAPLGVH